MPVSGADQAMFISTKNTMIEYGAYILLAAIVVMSGVVNLAALRSERYRNRYHRNKSNTNSGVKLLFNLYFLGLPIALISAIFAIFLGNELYGDIARAAFPAVRSHYDKAVNVISVLPLHPKNMTEAYLLGAMGSEVKACRAQLAASGVKPAENAAGIDDCTARITKRAEALTGRKDVTADEIIAVESVCRDLDGNKGLISKFFGIFSLINVIWFVSIVGVCATLLPFLAVFLGPLAQWLASIFMAVIFPICVWIAKMVLKPFGGVILYFLALWAVVESSRYPSNDVYSMSGTMVACLGLGLAICAHMYITVMHAPHDGGNEELFICVSGTLFTLVCVPLAIAHQSKLLGYLAVGAFVLSITFSIFAVGLFFFFWWGFNEDDAVLQGISSCLTLKVVFAALHAADVNAKYLAPFDSAVNVVGTTGYMWALLLWSFAGRWGDRHIVFIVNLIVWAGVGLVTGNLGMANVSLTFAGLYGFIFICWVSTESNIIIGLFVSFVMLYLVASALSNHPEYLSYAIFGAPN